MLHNCGIMSVKAMHNEKLPPGRKLSELVCRIRFRKTDVQLRLKGSEAEVPLREMKGAEGTRNGYKSNAETYCICF